MQLARRYFHFMPISSWHLATFQLWLWSCTQRGKMVSVLVKYATSKVFTLVLAQTMSPCDKTIFLELHPTDISLLIFPSALMRNWWCKHATLKWCPTMPHTNGSLKNMALRAYQCWVPYPLFPFLPYSHSISGSNLGEFNPKSHWVLDWRVQRLGSPRRRLLYQATHLEWYWIWQQDDQYEEKDESSYCRGKQSCTVSLSALWVGFEFVFEYYGTCYWSETPGYDNFPE